MTKLEGRLQKAESSPRRLSSCRGKRGVRTIVHPGTDQIDHDLDHPL